MFDLALLLEFAVEQRLPVQHRPAGGVEVELGENYVICFENGEAPPGTLIYFRNSSSGWHSHGDLFADSADDIALVPITVLSKLLDGELLVSEAHFSTGKVEISLTDRESGFDLASLKRGERQLFYRVGRKDEGAAD